MRMSYAVLAGSTVAAGATALALLMHRTLLTCAYLVARPGSSCAAGATDYPVHLRAAIIAAGLIAGSSIVLIGRLRPGRASRAQDSAA
jgi:hypothetical protein